MKKESFIKRYGLLILTGLVVGGAAVLLTAFGNPKNMGFCIACFLRDIAGALNFQRAGFDAEVGTGIVQYIRPEVIGLVLGKLCESNLRRALIVSKGSWATFFTSPISLFFILLSLFMLFFPYIKKKLAARRAAA